MAVGCAWGARGGTWDVGRGGGAASGRAGCSAMPIPDGGVLGAALDPRLPGSAVSAGLQDCCTCLLVCACVLAPVGAALDPRPPPGPLLLAALPTAAASQRTALTVVASCCVCVYMQRHVCQFAAHLFTSSHMQTWYSGLSCSRRPPGRRATAPTATLWRWWPLPPPAPARGAQAEAQAEGRGEGEGGARLLAQLAARSCSRVGHASGPRGRPTRRRPRMGRRKQRCWRQRQVKWPRQATLWQRCLGRRQQPPPLDASVGRRQQQGGRASRASSSRGAALRRGVARRQDGGRPQAATLLGRARRRSRARRRQSLQRPVTRREMSRIGAPTLTGRTHEDVSVFLQISDTLSWPRVMLLGVRVRACVHVCITTITTECAEALTLLMLPCRCRCRWACPLTQDMNQPACSWHVEQGRGACRAPPPCCLPPGGWVNIHGFLR